MRAYDDAKSSVEEEVRQRALLRADIEESSFLLSHMVVRDVQLAALIDH